MEFVIVSIAVIIAAGLTFFSGFGLGTIMLPVFSLFFDIPTAVGATAVVHLSNNLFKFLLVYKHIHVPTLIRFGVPAFAFAAVGGFLLTQIEDFKTISTYSISNTSFEITPVGLTIGLLMIFFAWFDLDPRFEKWNISSKQIPFGGMLSGFFGGVSGHQGAFRATFLAKAGLTKEQFIGTSNSISLIVDLSRLSMYLFFAQKLTHGENKFLIAFQENFALLLTAIIFAFLGTYIGKQLVKKTTITSIRKVVGILLFVMGTLMAIGII